MNNCGCHILPEQCQIMLGEIIDLANSVFFIRTAELNLKRGLENRKASLLELFQMLKHEPYILMVN